MLEAVHGAVPRGAGMDIAQLNLDGEEYRDSGLPRDIKARQPTMGSIKDGVEHTIQLVA